MPGSEFLRWTTTTVQVPKFQDELLLYDQSVGKIGIGTWAGEQLLFFPSGHITDAEYISHWILLHTPFSCPSIEGWISIEDKLPATDERVVFYVRSPKHRISIGKRKSDGDWTDVAYAKHILRQEVSHWMPLPAPPE